MLRVWTSSTNIIPFHQVLMDELSSVVEYQQNLASSRIENSLPGNMMPKTGDLGAHFPLEFIFKIYIAILMAMTSSHITLILFIVLSDNQLTLEVSETFTIGTDSSTNFTAFRYFWIVNRDEMARRADELKERLKLMESISNWARNITSDGFQQ
ncbi:MAG: hypothetical protein BYD32DRAFT_433322 [Podila humilis]|nr:MAG: hypothetical protein BYD32DRAFT_433322 [Podila humilis]